MYWYYKYPVLVLLILVVFGLGYLVWTNLPDDVMPDLPIAGTEGGTGVTGDVAGTEDMSGDVDAGDEREDTGPLADRVLQSESDSEVDTVKAELLQRIESAQKQLDNENLVAARTLAEKVLQDPALQRFSNTWIQAAEIISRVNTVLVNSDAPAPEKAAYIVKEGDSLAKIAADQNTTVGALQRFNDLDPTNPIIYPGNVLYVIQGTWSVFVSKSRYRLLLMNDGRLFKMYPVGIGRQNRTPVGVFEVSSKVREPAWTPPGRHIPYGDPENVLGTRWLGIRPIEGTDKALKGYGIHGTWQPETVGTAASQGCIRMRNEDVNELYDLVPKGTRVVIEDD